MKSKKKNSTKKSVENEGTIHIRLESGESIQSKRDLLSSEIGLINAIKSIKTYHFLKNEEFKIKLKLSKKIIALNVDLKGLQKNFPKIKIPSILGRPEIPEVEPEKKVEKIKEINQNHGEGNFEDELLKIQKKLNSLANTNNF
jgi:hypothetical protein